MTYLAGFFGFAVGFYAGLMILKSLLRGKSNEELRSDKALWWRYGWVVWVTAIFGCWLGIQTYFYIYLS